MSQKYTPIKKIVCAFHPTQYITNFCAHYQCLMPLCPTCIVSHTQQHYQQVSHPIYENIQQAINKNKQLCISNLNTLQGMQDQLKNIAHFQDNLKMDLKRQMNHAKEIFYKQICKIVDRYQKQMFSIIMRDYSYNGIYQQQISYKYDTNIRNLINDLYEKLGMFKGQQCLAALIKYKSQTEPQVKNLQSQIKGIITEFKKSKLQVTIQDKIFRDSMTKIMDDVLTVKTVTYDSPIRKNKQISKQQVIQRYITPQKYNKSGSRQKKRIFDNSRSTISPAKKPDSSVYMMEYGLNSSKKKKYNYNSLV